MVAPQKINPDQLVIQYLDLWQDHWQELFHTLDLHNIWSQFFYHPNLKISPLIPIFQQPSALKPMIDWSTQLWGFKRSPSRALTLHLGIATSLWASARQGLPSFHHGTLSFGEELEDQIQSIRNDIAVIGLSAFQKSLDQEVIARSFALTEGVLAYLKHPDQRTLSTPKILWQQDNAKLYDYAPKSDGPIVLVIPSLINRPYILDLSTKKSLLRFFAKQGLRPLLLDWGEPSNQDSFSLDDYLVTYLEPALTHTLNIGKEVNLLGYCMGGLFALALAIRQPKISKLLLLATPWDFSAYQTKDLRIFEKLPEFLVGTPIASLPADILQVLFYGLNPQGIINKFCSFAKLDPQSQEAKDFVALEDWVNDGVDFSATTAQQCFEEWFKQNLPTQGIWKIAGTIVDPKKVTQPTLIISSSNDRIVPYASTIPLTKALPNAQVITCDLGHTGIIVSEKAPRQRMAEWLGNEDLRFY